MCRLSEASSLSALAEALDDISREARGGLASAELVDPTPAGARRIYGALCLMVLRADRRSLPARGKVLEAWRRKLVVPPEDAQLIAELARRARSLRLGRRPRELALLLEGMVAVATAGGTAPTPRDELLMARVAERAGWARAEVGAAVARALAPRPAPDAAGSAVFHHKATRADLSGTDLIGPIDRCGRTDLLPPAELPAPARDGRAA